MSRVCIVLVNWNGWRDTVECLESLSRLNHPDTAIVVCDNGSSDGSLERLQGWAQQQIPDFVQLSRAQAESGGDPARESRLTLVEVGENLGFAGGNNVALRYALARGFDYCWLLNNDTVVDPDALTRLVERMQQPGTGICGSTLLHYEDRTAIQALGGGFYHHWIGLPWHYGRFSRWSGSTARACRAESRMNYVEGASMLVSRRFLLQVGLLCEDYFLFFEEADWAVRAKGRFTLGYAPESVVYHKVGKSIGTSSNPGKKSLVCDFYNTRNRILFARRHYPATLPTVYLVLVAELLLRLVCGKWDRIGMIARLMLTAGEGRAPRP